MTRNYNPIALTSFILRTGLAVVFLYAGIAAFISPNNWIGYIPEFIGNFITKAFILTIFSAYEVILALWLLSGKKQFIASIFSSITLICIIIANITILDIVFRDIAILLMAVALGALTYGDD